MPEQPRKQFGTRMPAPVPVDAPVKRSKHVALLLMGSLAIGGSAYALRPADNCEPKQPGMASELQTGGGCGSSSGGGHGGSGGSASRRGLFSDDSASSRSPSATAPEANSGGVTRGGFGSFARSMAAHFSIGG
jgi:hypothetical protein